MRVLIAMIEHVAPDASVSAAGRECAKMDKGMPAQQAKLSYLLHRKGVEGESIETTIEEDMDNALTLLRALHDGNHEHAQRLTPPQLNALWTRME